MAKKIDSDLTVTGVISGGSILGDGSQLTNLPSTDLSAYTTLSTTSAISGNLQAQITNSPTKSHATSHTIGSLVTIDSYEDFSYGVTSVYELGDTTYNITKYAQSFVLGADSSTVKSLQFYLQKIGSPSQDLIFTIETDNAGTPSGTLVDANLTKTLNPSDVSGTAGWVKAEFDSTGSLSNGVTYWVVVDCVSDIDTTNTYRIFGSVADGDAGVGRVFGGFGWDFTTAVSFEDVAFIIEEEDSDVIPNATGSTVGLMSATDKTKLDGIDATYTTLSTTSAISGNLQTQITNNIIDLGSVSEDILPTISGGPSLGSVTKPFKDLFVTENSIHMGETTLSITNGNLSVGGNEVLSSGEALSSDIVTSGIISGATVYGDGSNLTNLPSGGGPSNVVDDGTGVRLGDVSGNVATGLNAIAEGYNTTASGDRSHAEGNSTQATNYNSHAEGSNTIASGDSSHAEGISTSSSALGSHSEGFSYTSGGIKATGKGSHSEGNSEVINGIQATGEGSHAEGYAKTGQLILANGIGSHAEGTGTTAYGNYSHAEGKNTTATLTSSHAEGTGTTASGHHSHAEGQYTTAIAHYGSHAEGYSTYASGNYGSHAEGQYTQASGLYGSHAEGKSSTASGNSSHAEGDSTTASGLHSHAEGKNTIASGIGSHVEGTGYGTPNTASGNYSHSEGRTTTASQQAAHAEGEYTIASAGGAHAEGKQTLASAGGAHAEGSNTTASGSYSHAEGGSTIASGSYSHASGQNAKALHANTFTWSDGATFQSTITKSFNVF